MRLAQHQIALLFPALIVMAKTAVPITVRMPSPVLFPQQLQGGVLVPLQLLFDVGEIRWSLDRRPADTGNNFALRSDSDISAGSGQFNPAAPNRSTYSCTVLWLTFALRAI
jgi:hypothetical protein